MSTCLSLQPEEKQKASQQFSKLQTAMKVLGISPEEQKVCWLILAAIYHLGAAGATKGNLPGVSTTQLVAGRACGGPAPVFVCPHPAQASLLADSPRCLPGPPAWSRRLQTPREAFLPLDLGSSDTEHCGELGGGSSELREEEKGPNSEQSP